MAAGRWKSLLSPTDTQFSDCSSFGNNPQQLGEPCHITSAMPTSQYRSRSALPAYFHIAGPRRHKSDLPTTRQVDFRREMRPIAFVDPCARFWAAKCHPQRSRRWPSHSGMSGAGRGSAEFSTMIGSAVSSAVTFFKSPIPMPVSKSRARPLPTITSISGCSPSRAATCRPRLERSIFRHFSTSTRSASAFVASTLLPVRESQSRPENPLLSPELRLEAGPGLFSSRLPLGAVSPYDPSP